MDTYEELLFAELDFYSDVDMERELLDELMKLEEDEEVDRERNRLYRPWLNVSKASFDEVFFNELDCLNDDGDGGKKFNSGWGNHEHLAQGVKRLAEKVTRNWRGTGGRGGSYSRHIY